MLKYFVVCVEMLFVAVLSCYDMAQKRGAMSLGRVFGGV